jgi:hypothetical protein
MIDGQMKAQVLKFFQTITEDEVMSHESSSMPEAEL